MLIVPSFPEPVCWLLIFQYQLLWLFHGREGLAASGPALGPVSDVEVLKVSFFFPCFIPQTGHGCYPCRQERAGGCFHF